MTFASLFTGGGGADIGAMQAERLTTPSDELLSAANELLKLLRDSYRDDETIADAIERLENAVTAATASKITPSPAGSWRKAGGVLSKSQGQQ